MTESPDSSSSSSSAAVRRRPEPVPPLSSPGAGTRKWNAESRWRAFLRPSDYRTPDSFDEASERFSLNLPYYLTQYAAIGALTVLAGALLSGGVAFVLAVVVALLLVIIAISLTSRIELANSTRFLVFLLVTTLVSVVFWFTEDMRLGSQCFIIWFSSLLLPLFLVNICILHSVFKMPSENAQTIFSSTPLK